MCFLFSVLKKKNTLFSALVTRTSVNYIYILYMNKIPDLEPQDLRKLVIKLYYQQKTTVNCVKSFM